MQPRNSKDDEPEYFIKRMAGTEIGGRHELRGKFLIIARTIR